MVSSSIAAHESILSKDLHFVILRSAVVKKFTQQGLLRISLFALSLLFFAAHFYYFFIYNDFSFFVKSCLDSFEISFTYFREVLYIVQSEYSIYAVIIIFAFPLMLSLIGFTVIADYRRYRSQINFIETKAREIA